MEEQVVASRYTRIRRCERISDPDRFYCPFPGCNRSFIDLWRLKVHYRAASDVRGSGKERGHGLELPACPKCGKVLERGRHHVNCAAGKAAPSQASKKADRGGEGGKSLKRKAVCSQDGQRKMKGVLTPTGNLQISLDSAVHAAAPSSLPSPGHLQLGMSSNSNMAPAIPHGDNLSRSKVRLKPGMASRRPPALTISPVETPLFEGQPDSRDSALSTDTYAGLSPIPIALPAGGNAGAVRSGGFGSGQQLSGQNASNVNVVAMPAQSITPRGPGPLNLSDCQVTQGYAVFVEGNEAYYDVFFVPEGAQEQCNLQVDSGLRLDEK